MMGELATVVMDSGESYHALLLRARGICEDILLDSAREDLRGIVSQMCTLQKKALTQTTTVRGTLYNIFLHWLKEDLHFIAKRDIFEAQQCLHADYPDYKGNKLGELNRFAGEDLLQGFGEFMNQATPLVRRDGEQHIHLHNNEDETPERVREKELCGVVLLYLTTHQQGWQVGVNAAVQDLFEKAKREILWA